MSDKATQWFGVSTLPPSMNILAAGLQTLRKDS
jgi:hypothetical protein